MNLLYGSGVKGIYHEITTLEVTPRILGLCANVFFHKSKNFYFFRINPIVNVRYGISNYNKTINQEIRLENKRLNSLYLSETWISHDFPLKSI